MTARAFWVEQPGQGVIREEVLPNPGPSEVQVRMLYSGVSRGTESLVFRGRVPASQHQAMRCPHQAGAFSLPIKYGYIAVGEVEAGAGEVGQHVFCLHPHQTRFVIPASAVVPLPEGLPPARAVLAANLEVGILLAWVLQREGCQDLELIDLNPARREVAQHLGLPFASPDQARSERDRVFHASGSPAGLRHALSLCAPEATVVELSWFGDAEVGLFLGEAFHARRLTIRSSQVGQIAPSHRGEWTYRRRLDQVLQLLADHPELDVLIDGESSFEDLPETMSDLAESGSGVLCHRVCY